MGPQLFDHGASPQGEMQEFRADQFKIVGESFLELFELLEEYAPVWYTEKHHERAAAAMGIVQKGH